MSYPSGERSYKGWYSRGYLPHLDQPGLIQAITFRLHDSMPAERRFEWEPLLQIPNEATRRARIQAYLDADYGKCWLADARVAQIVENALLYFDGERYRLLAWVVMPNHVHVLITTETSYPLHKVVQSWKAFTARRANDVLGRTGTFWQRDYFDRYIRDEHHLEQAVCYIHANPILAGLVERAEDWPFGSARYVDAPDESLVTPYEVE